MNEVPKGHNLTRERKGVRWSLEKLSRSSLTWRYSEHSTKIVRTSLCFIINLTLSFVVGVVVVVVVLFDRRWTTITHLSL